MTKAEAEHLVASVQPRVAPRDGLRKLPAPTRPVPAPESAALLVPAPPADVASRPCLGVAQPAGAAPAAPALELAVGPDLASAPTADARAAAPHCRRTAELHPVNETEWSLRVTLDRETTEDLETLRSLLSHKYPKGDLFSIVREAFRCAIEKHGKRKGAVSPRVKRPTSKPATPAAAPAASEAAGSADPYAVPAEVRRQVWERDGGCCTWTSPDGHRCGSTWQVEIDHIVPPLLGGTSSLANLRLLCKQHNRESGPSRAPARPAQAAAVDPLRGNLR